MAGTQRDRAVLSADFDSLSRRRPRAIQPDLIHAVPRLVRGELVQVLDANGRRFLDAAAGVGVMSLGYTVPEVVEAMSEQASTLPYAHAQRFDSEPAQQFAEELALMAPDEIRDFFFCNGGSEAVESALKIARQYQLERGETSRYRFIGRWQSFHGNTIAAQSVGGHLQRRRRHSPLLIDFPHIEAPNCYRCGRQGDHSTCGEEFADLLRLAIERAGPETVAGFILEPVTGATSGGLVPPPGYLRRIREICDEYGLVLIFDEVYTAAGRTGRNFAFDHWGVLPDLVTMGKGIGGGFVPIGAVGIRSNIVEAFETGSGYLEHNLTFSSHPVTCRVGATVTRLIRERGLIGIAATRGKLLQSELEPLRRCRTVGDVRGLGLLVGIELVSDKATRQPFSPKERISARLSGECLERGLLVYPGSGTVDGIRGDHVLLTPPLTISEDDIARIGSILLEAVTALESDLDVE